MTPIRLPLPAILFLLASPGAWAGNELPKALEQWMNYEQKSIVRTVDPNKIMSPTIAKQKVEYRPETGNWFDLQSVWVPADDLNIAQADALIPGELHSELIREKDGKLWYRLFVHPESKGFYKEILDKYPLEPAEYQATATASSRSLLVRAKSDPSKMFFAKVSLNVELGGVTRTILRDESARGIGTAMYLDEATKGISKDFKFIPEVLGIIPKGWKEGGQIIRLIPKEVTSGESTLVPLFSLYAQKPEGSLIERLSKQAGQKPSEFVADTVLKPFTETWTNWAIHGPVVMEAHAQNVLLELDAQGKPTKRFFMRDLGGFEIDLAAPGFKKDLISKAPVFKDFHAEYFPKSIEEMQEQSLSTYFEGGFLYNVDKELQRVEPGYKAGSIQGVFWEKIGDELARQSGLPRSLFARAQLEKRMPFLLKVAQQKAANPGKSVSAVIEEVLASGSDPVVKEGQAWIRERTGKHAAHAAETPGVPKGAELTALEERPAERRVEFRTAGLLRKPWTCWFPEPLRRVIQGLVRK